MVSELTTESDRATPEPINPDEIEITVNYEPDPTDLVLSSVPGGELFDPCKHKFSEEDLKPQPMIKKAKKVLVPEEQKVCKLGINGMNQLTWCVYIVEEKQSSQETGCLLVWLKIASVRGGDSWNTVKSYGTLEKLMVTQPSAVI